MFVVLQVIVELLRWASFSDGKGSLMFNWKTLWEVWIMVLGDNWCWAFKRMEGGGQEATIWRGRQIFLFGVTEANFWFYLLGRWHLFGFGLYLVEDESPFGFFFSWTWHLIFCCAKSIRKELGGLEFAF